MYGKDHLIAFNPFFMNQFTIDPFQAVADPSRRAILLMLSKDRLTINAVAENFKMSRPAVSKHIKILYDAGFITIEESGRERYCSLRQDGFNALRGWMDYFDKCWGIKLKAPEQHLAAGEGKKEGQKNKPDKQ